MSCKLLWVYIFIDKAGIVENLGQFDRLLKPGFNTINPCTERVTEVDLKIQFIHTSNNSVITKDNIQL